MTSTPASRSARATTFAPRSWPSSPTFATITRILPMTASLVDAGNAVLRGDGAALRARGGQRNRRGRGRGRGRGRPRGARAAHRGARAEHDLDGPARHGGARRRAYPVQRL